MRHRAENPSPRLSPVFGIAALACVLLSLVAVFAVAALQARDLRNESDLRIYFLRQHLKDEVKDEIAMMDGLLAIIAERKELQEAWALQDRSLLMERAFPLFQPLRVSDRVTHFYFLEPDHTCVLRVHNPAAYGDKISRLTLEVAEHSRKTASGIELGPFGTLTVRVVRPWIVGGHLVGYLEMGEEVDGIFREIAGLVSADVLLTVDKKNLDRKGWQEGMAMTGKGGNWELFRDIVLSSSSLAGVGREMAPYLEAPDDSTTVTLTHNGRSYQGGYDRIVDVGGNAVGRFLLLWDVTPRKRENLATTGVVALASFGISALFLALLRRRLRSLS